MVKYNKNGTVTKGNRQLSTGGPRDRQRALAAQDSMKELQSLKKELQDLTSNVSTSETGYSKKEVQALVNDSIEEVSIDLESKYLKEIKELKASVASKDGIISDLTGNITKLEDKLDKKDDTILELTNKVTSISTRGYAVQPTEEIGDPDRPGIEKVFIDPTKKGAEDKYESHVKMAEKESSKGNVSSSVNKLKALIGSKLPKI